MVKAVIGCGFLECGARPGHGFLSITALSPMLADGMKVAVHFLSENCQRETQTKPNDRSIKLPNRLGMVVSVRLLLQLLAPPGLFSRIHPRGTASYAAIRRQPWLIRTDASVKKFNLGLKIWFSHSTSTSSAVKYHFSLLPLPARVIYRRTVLSKLLFTLSAAIISPRFLSSAAARRSALAEMQTS